MLHRQPEAEQTLPAEYIMVQFSVCWGIRAMRKSSKSIADVLKTKS